ncbi:MAG: threonine aldolase family protein [Acidimicrobiia bacterium]
MTTLPPPPEGSFASDNFAGVDPAVMAALEEANRGPAAAYGDDPWSQRAEATLRERFDAPVASLFCWGGTGANVVGLATVLQPWQAVLTPDTAHIVVDECGAPARFTGATVTPIAAPDGKLRPEHLDPYLHWLGVEHHPQPAVVSITQSTEMGTLYTVDEVAALCEKAHAHGLLVHLDGARIANALVALGTTLVEGVRDPGVDLMTLGLTKDGAMYGETVVFLRPELAERAAYVRKQAGQLPSKARYIAAQVQALLEDDRWLRNAAHANAMAGRLHAATVDIPGVGLGEPPPVNSLFPVVPESAASELLAWSFVWPWDAERSMLRWMTAWSTTEQDVDRFAEGVRAIVTPHL